ncbi:MAG TPA: hypothetical protein DIW46_13215 [Microbacterium sp.]|nr:hypothetical protein [Microbacterium sp.]
MTVDDEQPDPADMLALVKDQQRSIEGQRGAFVPLILFSWGIAWLLGFGALWLIDGLGDAFSLPIWVAAPIFIVLLAGAGTLSTIFGIRSSRGLRTGKDATFVGLVYGQTWWVGSLAIFALGQALVRAGMDADILRIFYPSAYIFFAGVMYVMAAAIWRAIPMLILGGWAILVSVLAPFAGYPAQYLVYALAGGGGFLLVALWSWIWMRRARRHLTLGGRS